MTRKNANMREPKRSYGYDHHSTDIVSYDWVKVGWVGAEGGDQEREVCKKRQKALRH